MVSMSAVCLVGVMVFGCASALVASLTLVDSLSHFWD